MDQVKAGVAHRARLPVLDGWRAVSILLVLAAHMLPVGPKFLKLNGAAGSMGMALFFTLSGFLIVRFLAEGMSIGSFAARRLTRIVPLSWTAIFLLTVMGNVDGGIVLRYLSFTANLPPIAALPGGEQLWSLCVEMQFYAAVVLLCLSPGRRGLYLIPFLCVVVTGLKIAADEKVSIITWYRVDEILAGGTVALIYCGWFGEWPRRFLGRLSVWPMLVFLLVTSHSLTGPLQYLRAYAGAAVVGVSLFNTPQLLAPVLQSRAMAYIADISYALYIFHGVLLSTWLASGEKLARYLKRPLLFAALFLLAHLSTFYFERPITRWARSRGKSRKASLAPGELPQ